MKFTPEQALQVGTQIHTSPEAFGKVMSAIKPRMAVAYHFFNDFNTATNVYERIRATYKGELSLAEDFMVWNITKDKIRTRMAVADDHTWAPRLAQKALVPGKNDREEFAKGAGVDMNSLHYSKFISEGTWNVDDVLRPIYKATGKEMGREFKYPGDK